MNIVLQTNSDVQVWVPGHRRGLLARLLALGAVTYEAEARVQRDHDPASDRVRRLMDDADWLADLAEMIWPER